MSRPITLLGLGHLAGVLGRLHAAALVAPEALIVAARAARRGGVARCGGRPSTVASGAFPPLPREMGGRYARRTAAAPPSQNR